MTPTDDTSPGAEAFEQRIDDPEAVLASIREDADDIEASLKAVLEDADALLDAVGARERPSGIEKAGEADASERRERLDGTTPSAAWAEAELRRRVLGLLFEDLRAELAGVRRCVKRGDGENVDGIGEVSARLDDIEAFREDIGHRLDDVFDPAWVDGYGEVVLEFDRAMSEMDPPIDWADVEEAMARHRERLPEGGARGED